MGGWIIYQVVILDNANSDRDGLFYNCACFRLEF